MRPTTRPALGRLTCATASSSCASSCSRAARGTTAITTPGDGVASATGALASGRNGGGLAPGLADAKRDGRRRSASATLERRMGTNRAWTIALPLLRGLEHVAHELGRAGDVLAVLAVEVREGGRDAREVVAPLGLGARVQAGQGRPEGLGLPALAVLDHLLHSGHADP